MTISLTKPERESVEQALAYYPYWDDILESAYNKICEAASQPASWYYVSMEWLNGDRKLSTRQYSDAMTKNEATELARHLNCKLAKQPACQLSTRFSVAKLPASHQLASYKHDVREQLGAN